jgi:hypothetical protein
MTSASEAKFWKELGLSGLQALVFRHRDFHIKGTMNNDNNSGEHAAVDPKIFSAIITPHRSLGPRGFLIFMLCLAWPVQANL